MSLGWGAVGRLGIRIAGAVGSVLVAGGWVWLLWLQLSLDSDLISRGVVGCQAPTSEATIPVLAAITVVLGTALLGATNAYLLVRFPGAWWLQIAPVLLFLALTLGLLAMAWLTVLFGTMWMGGGPGRSGTEAFHGDVAGAILMGWLLAPILVSLVALVVPLAVGSRIPRDGRLVVLSAAVPLALYGIGFAVTVVLQAVRCPA